MRQFKRIFLAAFLFVFELQASNVYIYDDLGSCEECVKETIRSISENIEKKYNIMRINHKSVIAGEWIKDAALFVMPGGRAAPYGLLLNGNGNRVIKSYVEQGGSFLGLCAGAYYAGSFVEFAKNTNIEVLGSRELAFFKNTVVGPALAPYDYYSESGARAASITIRDNTYVLYYNGGGYFKDAANMDNTRVLALYKTLEPEQPAIVECEVERGIVILSGVHFECSSSFLERVLGTEQYSLDELEKQRKNLIREILLRLKLEVKS